MTDLPPADAPVADAPAPAPAPAAEPSAPPPADAPAGDAPAGGEPDTFPRDYVEELRNEAAKYRVTAKEREEALSRYASPFEGMDDETIDSWLGLTSTVLSDPAGAGARELVRIAKGLAGENFDSLLQDDPTPLTPEQVQAQIDARLKEERDKAEADAELRKVYAKTEELGYPDESPERALFFWFANKKADADLDKAHEMFQSWKKDVISSYVAEQRERNSAFPPVADAVVDGAAPPADEAPRNIKEASARARERIARMTAAAAQGA